MKSIDFQPDSPRRFPRPLFALWRGYLEGLSPAELARRYLDLEDEAEAGEVARRVESLRTDLAPLMTIGERAILRRRASAIRIPAAGLTLDDLEARYPGFSERELLAMPEAQGSPGGESAQERRARLLRRQLEILKRLELGHAIDPLPEHVVATWFDPALATRLVAAGIKSLGELVAVVDARPAGWHRAIDGFGDAYRARVDRWLERQGAGLRAKLPRPSSPFVPIASPVFAAPPGLEGYAGANRLPVTPRITLPAGQARLGDAQAVQAWVALHQRRPASLEAAEREAERFLLYLWRVRRKALADATTQDCESFMGFLARPHADWCGPPAAKLLPDGRVNPAWRPFRDPQGISVGSQKYARSTLERLCEWLAAKRYLDVSPWADLPAEARGTGKRREERVLLLDDVLDLMDVAEGLGSEGRAQLRFAALLRFGYRTGFRLAEVAGAAAGDIDGKLRLISTVGKGAKPRTIPLAVDAREALAEYLGARGLRLRSAPSDTPLFAPVDLPQVAQARALPAARAMSPHGVHQAFLPGLARCREALRAQGRIFLADKLEPVSMHWLRHSCATHLLDGGMSLTQVRDFLGHASEKTTSIYSHAAIDKLAHSLDEIVAAQLAGRAQKGRDPLADAA